MRCNADETGKRKNYAASDIELIDSICRDTMSPFTFKNDKYMSCGIVSIQSMLIYTYLNFFCLVFVNNLSFDRFYVIVLQAETLGVYSFRLSI